MSEQILTPHHKNKNALVFTRDANMNHITQPNGFNWRIVEHFCFSALEINGSLIVRCTLREDLINYVNENYHECLITFGEIIIKDAKFGMKLQKKMGA